MSDKLFCASRRSELGDVASVIVEPRSRTAQSRAVLTVLASVGNILPQPVFMLSLVANKAFKRLGEHMMVIQSTRGGLENSKRDAVRMEVEQKGAKLLTVDLKFSRWVDQDADGGVSYRLDVTTPFEGPININSTLWLTREQFIILADVVLEATTYIDEAGMGA